MKTMTMTALAAVTLLSACGGSSSTTTISSSNPTILGNTVNTNNRGAITANADGSFRIVDDGNVIDLPASNVILNQQVAWINGTDRANSFVNDDVTLLGGISDGVAFSGIDGTLSAAPTGNARFEGRYSYNSATTSVSGPLTLVYDFADRDIETPDGSDFEVDGDVAADGSIIGEIEYKNVETAFTGGFYGDGTVGGAFDSGGAAGIFYGTK
ncbi:hypothetical protein FHS72_001357 [Loktanella ponticola]|uniref:Transferrin-binding protein B C-lobe/N-lobe beta barrel domain-containing protein n=1 Tax=Yoonia ponticola TaxID=1524255 RepID=A0A7W9BJT3_9RHOB|nr:hypothetical protein [Yoonia ponticola]MBB5721745.1 hypothetical protein [Yoonia ponticola]